LETLEEGPGYVLLRLRVQPKAARAELKPHTDGRIKASVTDAPENGAANKAVCTLMARRLGLPKRAVTVAHGEKSRDKTLRLEGAEAAAVRALLSDAVRKEKQQ